MSEAEAIPVHQPQSDTQAAGMTWTLHLLRRQPGRLPRLVAAIVLVLTGGFLVFHTILYAALSALTLLFSLSEFLFPIHYVLTERSAIARHGIVTLEIAWEDVRHAYLAPDGVKLSPLARSHSISEPLRGVFLRFADNEDEVIAAVQYLRREAAHA